MRDFQDQDLTQLVAFEFDCKIASLALLELVVRFIGYRFSGDQEADCCKRVTWRSAGHLGFHH